MGDTNNTVGDNNQMAYPKPHVHHHVNCVHFLEFCGVCDVCYCKNCGQEWRGNNLAHFSRNFGYPSFPNNNQRWLCAHDAINKIETMNGSTSVGGGHGGIGTGSPTL